MSRIWGVYMLSVRFVREIIRSKKLWHSVAVLLLVFFFYQFYVGITLEMARDRLRVRELPTTIWEVVEWNRLPKGAENAADLFDAVLASMPPEYRPDAELPYLGTWTWDGLPNTYPPEALESMATFISDNAEMYGGIHDLLGSEYYQYRFGGVDTDDPYFFATLDHRGAELRTVARMLGLKVAHHTLRGEGSAATDAAVDGLRFGGFQQPFVVGTLNMRACDSISVGALSTLLSWGKPSDSDLLRIGEALLEREASDGLEYTVATEAAYIAYRMSIPREESAGRDSRGRRVRRSSDESRGGLSGKIVDAWRVGSAIRSRDIALAFLCADQMLEYETYPTYEAEEKYLAYERELLASLFRTIRVGFEMEGEISPLSIRGQARAEFRSARTAVAIERYRLDHASLPDALVTLVPDYLDEIPADPFDGAPLRYRVEESGYVVYSIGTDHEDQGGYDFDEHKVPKNDIAFVVHRP